MIASVYAVLSELGLPKPLAAQPLYARLAGNLTFIVFCESNTSFQVKVSTAFPLANEFSSLQTAFSVLPLSVAEPLGLISRDGYEFMVCRGLPHKVLLNIHSAKLSRIFVREINRFSTALHSRHQFNTNTTHSQKVAGVLAHFKGAGFSPLLRDWIAQLANSHLDKLPHVDQHGDFAINNIGLATDHLVYFDWEDFGKIQLPGFDICVLLMSLSKFNIDQLRQRLACGDSVETLIVEHCCQVTGIEKQMFYKLIPVYLLLFLYLKDIFNYGEKIMSQTIKTLNAYLAHPFTVAERRAIMDDNMPLNIIRAVK